LKKILVIFSILIISACGKTGDNDSSTSSVSSDDTVDSVAASNESGYNQIDWQTMDADKDGYVSPEEMVNHYNSTGVYK
jgi:hypothetical protein